MVNLPIARDVRKPKPRPRPLLSWKLAFGPIGPNPGLLKIWMGRSCTDYEIRELASDWGLAFSLTKLTVQGPTTTYHVCLDAENGTDGRHVCDCMGHEAHGTNCKHIRTLLRLLERGELTCDRQPLPPPAPLDDDEAPF
jgi:hypothetical protein